VLYAELEATFDASGPNRTIRRVDANINDAAFSSAAVDSFKQARASPSPIPPSLTHAFTRPNNPFVHTLLRNLVRRRLVQTDGRGRPRRRTRHRQAAIRTGGENGRELAARRPWTA
jgi:hypothetical protein